MDLKREHAIEMLLLIAAVAVVQLPASAPSRPEPGPGAAMSVQISTAPVHEVRTESLASQRLDPIGLLQAGVPDDWRIALPDTKRAAALSNTC